MFVVGADLLQQTWEATLRDQAQLQDIYTAFEGSMSEEGVLPDGWLATVRLSPGAYRHTIGMMLDLVGAGLEGTDQTLSGNTEDMKTRSFTVYSNDVRHGVNLIAYGLSAFKNEPYKIMGRATPLLARWFKTREGKHIREALIQGTSSNLTGQTQRLNKNICIVNVAVDSQPVYDSTLATFTSQICTALDLSVVANAANSGARPSVFNTDTVGGIEYMCTYKWKLEPAVGNKFILVVPPTQKVNLVKLTNATSLGALANLNHAPGIAALAFARNLEAYEVGRIIFVVDDRAPVMDYNGSSSFTFKYFDTTGDARTYTLANNHTTWDVAVVLGKGAVTKALHEDLAFNEQYTDFERIQEVGAHKGYGYNLTEFDDVSPTDTTKINQNSGIVFALRNALTI